MTFQPTPAATLAVSYVNATHRHLFLTGKAGSGKTTLLHHIVANTHKNVAVAAPTGIAAINAGGVTLHSLLHLPFGTFIPENTASEWSEDTMVYTPKRFLAQLKMGNTKRDLLRQLELLVIDEVSMLRADMLDCIDCVLRSVRRKSEPFGGLQLLFIGDLNQLPPVIKNSEKALLSRYYPSGYFFEAVALILPHIGLHMNRLLGIFYLYLDFVFRQVNHLPYFPIEIRPIGIIFYEHHLSTHFHLHFLH